MPAALLLGDTRSPGSSAQALPCSLAQGVSPGHGQHLGWASSSSAVPWRVLGSSPAPTHQVPVAPPTL